MDQSQQEIGESQVSQSDQEQEKNPFQRIQLNEEDRDFLKFLEAKLQKTEQKIQSVQNALRESNTFQAEKMNQQAGNIINNQKDIRPEDVKGSLQENYIELFTKHKKLENDMETMVEKFQEKNRQINLLIKELKRTKQSEELCIKKMAEMKLQIEQLQENQGQNKQYNKYKPIAQNQEKNQENQQKNVQVNKKYNYNQNENRAVANQGESNLRQQDNFNFWNQDNKNGKKAEKPQKLDEILGDINGGNGLWVMEHDLRKKYREDQEKILQDKYQSSLNEEQQSLLNDVHQQQQILQQQEQQNSQYNIQDSHTPGTANSFQSPANSSKKQINSQKLRPINGSYSQNAQQKQQLQQQQSGRNLHKRYNSNQRKK